MGKVIIAKVLEEVQLFKRPVIKPKPRIETKFCTRCGLSNKLIQTKTGTFCGMCNTELSWD